MKNIIKILVFLISVVTYAQIQPVNFYQQFNKVNEADANDSIQVLVRTVGNPDHNIMKYVSASDIGGGGGISIHNNLTGIQGGSPNEYYHFNQTQHEKLLGLIYVNNVSTISVSPSSGERGVNTSLTVNYNINPNDDVFGTASINQGIGDVTNDIGDGNKSTSGGTSSINKTFTLSLNFVRDGVGQTDSKNATYNSYIPQWAGWSSKDDFLDNYSTISSQANFQKFIQSSASITKQVSPSGEYVWFISNKNNATILDGNNFVQTVGTWGDGTSEFYRKSLNLTLSDGITAVTVYLYRSRNTKTLSNFTYKIQ